MYKIESNEIIFTDGKTIQFDHLICQRTECILAINDILIILLTIPNITSDPLMQKWNRNVFGIDVNTKTVMWQIDPHLKAKYGYSEIFTDRLKTTNKIIRVGMWIMQLGGFDYGVVINPLNGKILEERFGYK